MKIDRRCFLSFAAAGAAGTALSPLPWKLADDSSIWSQNWPWTPVPKRGEYTYWDSACALCPGGCGITVRKVGKRSVKIEGAKGHPINDGGICLLGLSGLQLLYGPTRIKSPMVRKGERGGGHWEPVSWDEAISLLAEKLGALKEKGEGNSAACIFGQEKGTVPALMKRLLTAMGSANFFPMPSMETAYEMCAKRMQGVDGSLGFDLENSDFVLSFGAGIIDGWGSPVRMIRANSRWKDEGAKLVQIEPRLSNTAAKSDRWIPINPGTEAALALGMAHVMIRESLFNLDFIEKHTLGFEDFTDSKGIKRRGFRPMVMEAFGPETVYKITGVKAGVIVELARDFAKAAKPVAICGRGQGRALAGSLDVYMATNALNALMGRLDTEGGVYGVEYPQYINWPEIQPDEEAAAGLKKGRLDAPGEGAEEGLPPAVNKIPGLLAGGKGYPLKVLLVAGANPLYCLPDTATVQKALDQVEFITSFSSFMDETAAYADLLLPDHVYLERLADAPVFFGLPKPVVSLTKPVTAPVGNTRHLGNVVLELAKKMGGTVAEAFPWEEYPNCLEETMGELWEPLVNEGYVVFEDKAVSGFNTPSGKFEFVSTAFAEGQAPKGGVMPEYSPVKIPGSKNEYPLVLIPYDTLRLAHGYIGDPPFMIKTLPNTVLKKREPFFQIQDNSGKSGGISDVFVEINPETAKSLGISEGKTVTLTTPAGSAKVRVHLSRGIIPGVVAMPRGLGHTAYDRFLANKGVNVNELMSPVEDPATGLDAAWGIRAKLG